MDVKVSFISGCTLYLETSTTPEGPWVGLLTLSDAGYCRATEYFTGKESGTNRFQRFLRWQLTPPANVSGNWSMTFKLCATVR
jgi:hypothetical protein